MSPCVTEILKSKQVNTFFLRWQFFASERQNLQGDLYSIDPLIRSFDEESLCNAVLYGSHEFSNKKKYFPIQFNKSNLALICAALHRKPIILRCELGYVLSYAFLPVVG